MDDLLDASVTFAQEMLGRRGEFYPFGAVVLADGTVAMSAMDPGLGDHPDSVSVIHALEEVLRQQASRREIRASAICSDVRIEDDGTGMADAIRTTIEHRDADPVQVVLPYRCDERGSPEYGELRAAHAERTIFGA